MSRGFLEWLETELQEFEKTPEFQEEYRRSMKSNPDFVSDVEHEQRDWESDTFPL